MNSIRRFTSSGWTIGSLLPLAGCLALNDPPANDVVDTVITGASTSGGSCSLDTLKDGMTADQILANICTTVEILGSSGTAQCVSGTADAAVENVLASKTFWNASGAAVTGTMQDRGIWTLTGAGSTFPGAGYYSAVASAPGASNICSGTTVAGVAGSASCSSPPSIAIAGDLSWGATAVTAAKTLTFSIASAGSNHAKLSFSGTGTASFELTEIAGKSVSQLASASDAVLGPMQSLD